jgi:formylglycine-generating enzyme required for sulfatase activity
MDAIEDAAMPRQDNTTAVVIKIVDDNAAELALEEDDDSDDEDITTPGSANIGDTIEMEAPAEPEAETEAEEADNIPDESIDLTPAEEEPVEAIEEVAEAVPDAPPETIVEDVSSESSEKSKTGLIVGIAATVLIAVAAGGYFMFAGSKSEKIDVETVSEEVVVEETISEEQSSPTEVIEESAEEEIVETVTEAAPEPDTVVETQVQPVEEAEPAPAPDVANKKEFQDDLKDGGKAPLMVVIPAGSFAMGSSSSSRYTDERPRHTVKIDSFAVGKYEVTFAEYDLFAKATGRKPPKDLYMDRNTHPVIFVKWDDAYYYTKWLSEQTGKKYRLLSESEWEYAASTGKKSSFWWGYDEEPGRAHCFECETGLDPRKPSKVGGFEANNFGIHDTAGNVAEWVKDCWHENYKGAPSDSEVWEGGDCTYRAVRGGAYISPQQSIRSAKRDKLKSDAGYDHVGIRIARDLD